jgi:hypothetical protein
VKWSKQSPSGYGLQILNQTKADVQEIFLGGVLTSKARRKREFER